MQKKEIAEVQTKSKVDKKPKKILSLKKKIVTSSDSEEEEMRLAILSKKLPAAAIKNGSTVVSKYKDDSSDEHSDNSYDEEKEMRLAILSKKLPAAAIKNGSTVVSKFKDDSSDEHSDNCYDEEKEMRLAILSKKLPAAAIKNGSTVVSKNKDHSSDEHSDNSSDEEKEMKLAIFSKKLPAAAIKNGSTVVSKNKDDSSDEHSDNSSDEEKDDSAKVSTARKSVPVPIKRVGLTATPKKKDAWSHSLESYSDSDDEMIPAAKKFRHAEEISSEHVEIVSDDEGPQKIGLSAPSESSLTAPAPKRLCKGKKQVMSSYATKLVEASPTIKQRVATPACVYLLAEAIRELEKHPEIFEDAELYDFATVCFLTTTNRVTFLSIRADRRVAWLKNRYMSSLH